MSFLDTFNENVRKYPGKVALEFIDPPLQRVTYADLDDLVNRAAGYLRSLGLQPGDRVALQLSKSLEFILLHLAAVRLGAITLPLNLAYPPDELKYFLDDSGARLFFALESSKEKIQTILPELPDLQGCIFLDPTKPHQFQSLTLAPHASVGVTNYQVPSGLDTGFATDAQPYSTTDSATAVIIYTSGTTGRPKARRSRMAT